MDEPVTLINAFTVPPDEGDRFLEHWKDNARVMAAQPGFLDAAMYRSIVAGAKLQFVNVANWASAEALDAAHRHPDFTAATRRLMTGSQLNVVACPAVYRVAIPVAPHYHSEAGRGAGSFARRTVDGRSLDGRSLGGGCPDDLVSTNEDV